MNLDIAIEKTTRFIDRRIPYLYAGRRVILSNISQYSSYDNKLKREMIYFGYGVSVSVSECEIETSENGLTLAVMEKDAFDIPVGREGTTTFFNHLTRKINADGLLILPNFEIATAIVDGPKNKKKIQSTGVRKKSVNLPFPPDLSMEITDYCIREMSLWYESKSDFKIELTHNGGWKNSGIKIALMVAASRIDVDISGNKDADVLRWQETMYFENSGYSDASESDCLAILRQEGIALHRNSYLLGVRKFEISDNSSCICLRFEHRIFDVEKHPPSDDEVEALIRNRGFILVEDDFHEIYIDALKKIVIGEYYKWRAIERIKFVETDHDEGS